MPYPQAILPEYRTLGDELRDLNRAKPSNIDSPRIFVLTGGSDIVFDARQNSALGDSKLVSKLILHNLGVNPMYYAINSACGTGIGTFHDILAGGTALKDGLGSQVDLGKDQPNYVAVKGTVGEWIAVVISYPIDAAINALP